MINIGIVGGGTSGLICGIILKKYLNCNIDLIYSDSVGTIGVGEGSTEHFSNFMKFAGITHEEIIKECGATLKTGLLFEDWTESNYFHCVTPPFNDRAGSYPYVLSKIISDASNYSHPLHYLENKLPSFWIGSQNPPTFQYHFDSNKLVSFLMKFAKNIGINLIEDKISTIIVDNNNIESIYSDKRKYKYDFYIDATGFKKLLISQLGAKWVSYSEHLKMNAAFVFQTPDEENYNMWTLSKAMKYGWMFKTPVWGRHGNGYIYNDQYTDIEEAIQEAETVIGKPIKVGKEFKFDPGRLDKSWISNCCAIGLSSSFVEPIEATAIGSTIQHSFVLMQKIVNYNQLIIDSYNNFFDHMMENIKEFVFIHYLVNKSNSSFWRDIQTIQPMDSLKYKLERWKHKLPISEDFGGLSGYMLFHEMNFIQVLNGINFFDRSSIRNEFKNLNMHFQENASNLIKEYYKFENSQNYLYHKEYLEEIRNYL